MKKKKLLYIILFCMAVIFSSCGKGKSDIRLGTGDPLGTYYAYSSRLSEMLKDDFTFQLKSTVGSYANLRLLQKGFLDAALVQSDSLYRAEKSRESAGKDSSAEKRTYSAVAGLYTEALQIVVRNDSDIRTPGDLKGKRVSLGVNESGVLENALEILDSLKITEKDITPSYLSFTDSAEALKQGTIDAFFCMAGTPTAVVSELAETTEIRLLSFREQQTELLLKLYPYYFECIIPENTYKGQTEAVSTVGVRAVFVVSNSIDRSSVKKLTGEILDNSGTLNQNIVTDGSLSALDASIEVMIPFHRGAADYLKDHGVEVEEDPSDEGGIIFVSQDDDGGAK